jgi:phenylalanyl-tRNA synthetase beta chain
VKLSYDWLSDFVDLSGLTPEEVAEKLTMGAFEVEEIRRTGPDLRGQLVVGEIMEILPHPDPSVTKMRLTKTRIAADAPPEEIVCGAWNIEVGQKIPVALPGSMVINRKTGEPFPIERTEKRGVVSNGMLCSPAELGIAGGEDGILILESTTRVGVDVRPLLGLEQDAVLIVEPRSNRGDALSVLGLAREVAALFGRPLKQPDWTVPSEQISDAVDVSIENLDECPFFTIRVLSGVRIAPSPPALVRRLEAAGVRPVNNVVDITNYVMHELGQPLHAYDLRNIRGNHIGVRKGRSGEKLVTIDGREREINSEALMIADGSGVVGVAGVMGGKGSEIADDTTVVALEAAAFNSRSVRRSSRLLGLSSDSSLRFERGVDPAGVSHASNRAACLLAQHCQAKLGPLRTAGSDKVTSIVVPLRLSQVERHTELKIKPDEAAKLLTPLGFQSKPNGADALEVTVPSFRMRDVTREIDLVEEVTRLWGYDRVPVSMPKRTVAPPLPDQVNNSIREALCGCGLNETWISSLVALDDLGGRGSFSACADEAVHVLNPLSDEHQVLRLSLIPGLLKAVSHNQAHGMADVWIYELGLTYKRTPSVSADRSATGTAEKLLVSAAISGDSNLSSWPQDGANADERARQFYLLKGVVENLCSHLSIDPKNLLFASADETPCWFHPSRSARVSCKRSARDKEAQLLGWIGEVHPLVAEAYGLKATACLFELEVAALQAARPARAFTEFSNTPVVVRDLTADLSRSTEQAAVAQVIQQVGGKLLIDLQLVSIFDLSAELKSLSYRLSFQDPQQTLTAEAVDKSMNKIREQLQRQLSASFRL